MIHGFAPVMKLNFNAELAASPHRVNPSVFHCRRLVRLLKLQHESGKLPVVMSQRAIMTPQHSQPVLFSFPFKHV